MPNQRYHHGDLKNALIQAGVQVLAQGGVQNFSLRKVAQAAGVSHSAPYAHFADKQALIAAISTAGFEKLLFSLTQAAETNLDDPARQMLAVIDAYLNFAQSDPDHFRITFSTSVDVESDYPAFAESSKKNYELFVQLVASWQQAGFVGPGEPEIIAVSLWGLLHGIILLAMDRQIPLSVTGTFSLRELILRTFQQVVPIYVGPAAQQSG
jgi:AcrR family transcriptional regulator